MVASATGFELFGVTDFIKKAVIGYISPSEYYGSY